MAVIPPAIRGGEEVAYQERKDRKTTNALFLTNRNGFLSVMSMPVAGNHHDLHDVEKKQKELFAGLEKANIPVDGLFINADGGFDTEVFRNTCHRHGVIANVAFNNKNGQVNDEYLLDELLV